LLSGQHAQPEADVEQAENNTSTFEIEDPVDRRDEIIDDSTALEAKILSGRSDLFQADDSAHRKENEHKA
jgi:hypothetical protein